MNLKDVKKKKPSKSRKKQNIVSASISDEQMDFVIRNEISITSLVKTAIDELMKSKK